MGMIKLLSAPIRSIVRFPLFQLAIVVAVILFLQSADENSAFGHIFNGLDKLDDRFHETGIDEPSIHGTRSVLADSSFENG